GRWGGGGGGGGGQPRSKKIANPGRYNGNGWGSLLGGLCPTRPARHDNIDVLLNEIVRQLRKSSDIALGPSVFDDYVLSFDVTESFQSFPKCSERKPVGRGRASN